MSAHSLYSELVSFEGISFLQVQHSLSFTYLWSFFHSWSYKINLISCDHVTPEQPATCNIFLRWTTELSYPSWWRIQFLSFGFTIRCSRNLSCHQYGFLHCDWASALSLCSFGFVWEWSCKLTAVTEAGIERDGHRKYRQHVMKNVCVSISDQMFRYLSLQE